MKGHLRWIIGLACGGLLAALACPLTCRAQATGPEVVKGRVVDAQGKPVEGVAVASYWYRSWRGPVKDSLSAYEGATTDRDGRFSLEIQSYGRDTALLAMDRGRKAGGLAVVKAGKAGEPVTIKLEPMARVHGSFSCNDLGTPPTWSNVYFSLMPGGLRCVMNESEQARFDVFLPPGTYEYNAYGTDVDHVRKEITVRAGQTELDLGTIDLPATIIARHKGKEPPAWHVTDARGVSKDVKLSDFKGKWVLMEFWGFW
jgi:hypothetical protein